MRKPLLLALMLSLFPALHAQSPAASASASGLKFEVASVRPNKSNDKPSQNVQPTSGDAGFLPTGGLYSTRNIALVSSISFAYSLTNKQLQQVVEQAPWTAEERFDIEARAEGNPTKDQYREMMRSLLADRFKLAVHFETRDVPIYALQLARPDKLGPQLRLHRADDPVCALPPAQWERSGVDSEGFPKFCGKGSMKPGAPGRMKSGGRDVPMSEFAAVMAGVGVVNRPMVDQTGIGGNIDYVLEWQMVRENVYPPSAEFHPDESAPTFQEALRDQLGIKMVPKKGPVEFFVIDHIERPSAN